ncbi:LapA family protein [Amphritea sp. 1_MG-2023]|uniref:LapA family protein n=1 Tax=Amphritea sp. 1_MG-2023 TaxID=3062670 RepID=UPI0026E46273|nr:LapA family protein [Amphritea sp. 1_MG-2023]MDO6562764.1 LapA family protein [Amphritea sp. 1_MG-2023]
MGLLKILLVLALCIVFLFCGWTFATLNTELVSINLFFFTLPEASLSLWLMASFVVGGIAGVVVSSLFVMILKLKLQAAKRKISSADKELDQLRTAALKRST